MNKLLHILQSKKTIIFLSFIIIICSLLTFKLAKPNIVKTKTTIEGKVLNYKIDGDTLSLTLKDKEKYMVYYYFETEEEKEYYQNNLGFNDILNATGEISFSENNKLPNTFNYKKYLEHKNIYYIFNAKNISIVKKEKGLYLLKTKITNYLKAKNNNDYFLTMVMGNTSLLDTDSIRFNGISHLFAISGMHISLLIFFLSKLFRRLGSKNKIIIFIFLTFYAFLTSFTPSVLRASLMWLMTVINDKYNLGLNTRMRLFYICFIILIINPFYIYDIGFQYSFLISFFLTYAKPRKNYFTSLFFTSLIAFLASIPITANNYFTLNFLTIIWNLFFVPFVSFILYPLCFLNLLLPFLNNVFSFCITIFESINNFCSSITFAVITVPKVTIILWLIYFLFLFLLLKTKKTKYQILLALIFLLILIIPKLDSTFYTYYLNVSQGDSSLILTPYKNKAILIDTGGIVSYKKESWMQKRKESNNASNIKTFINSLGINKIDTLILTHGDYDHMGEAINLIEKIKIKQVIFNCGEFNQLEKELINVLNREKISYSSCIKELNIDNNKFYFLNTSTYDNENDNSSVIYLDYNNYKFLFMGDAGVQREKDILEKYNLNDIDFLKVGHHGSNTSSSKEFINSTNPKYSFISVGKNNRYGHPKNSVLNTLSNSKIYRTDIDGSIEIKINKNGYMIKTYPT